MLAEFVIFCISVMEETHFTFYSFISTVTGCNADDDDHNNECCSFLRAAIQSGDNDKRKASGDKITCRKSCSNWCINLIIQLAFTVTLPQSVAFHKRALTGRTFLIVSLTPAAVTLAALRHKVMNW